MYNHIRTGVIGVGSMGQNHARVYSEISNLVAVSDSDEAQGRRIAERFGVEWYSDYRQMLSEVDAVTIAVPTALHRKIAEEVVSAGLHILVEKPLAGNLVDAESIVNTAEKEGVTLAVGHIERYNPVVEYASREIREGKWGEIITMSAQRVSPLEIEALHSSSKRRIDDVGVLFDLSIHDIDVMSYLSGSKIVSVSAMGGSTSLIPHENHVNILMKFDNGIIGLSEANWLTPTKKRTLGITFQKHKVLLDFVGQKISISSVREVRSNKNENSSIADWDRLNFEVKGSEIALNIKEPLKCELIDFLESINQGKLPLVSGKDGLEAVKIIEQCKLSMESEKTIRII